MTDWRSEYGKKFKDDSDRARLKDEREVQKQRSVDANQIKLWDSLRNAARSAVEGINVDSNVLLFTESEPDSFNIVYKRDGGKERTAQVHFGPDRHTLTVRVSNPDKTGLREELKIVAKEDGELFWSDKSTPRVVKQILDSLL